jgi:hypothetical protein
MTQLNSPLKAEIKQAIVRSLRLPITPEEIGDDTPLLQEHGIGKHEERPVGVPPTSIGPLQLRPIHAPRMLPSA